MKTSANIIEPSGLGMLISKINEAHKSAIDGYRKSLSAALEAGALLVKAKGELGKHGKWLSWLRANCPDIPDRTASQYMRLHRNRAEIQETLKSAESADLGITAALALMARNPKSPAKPEDERPPSKKAESWDSPAIQMFGEWLGKEYPEAEAQKSILREIRAWIDDQLKGGK